MRTVAVVVLLGTLVGCGGDGPSTPTRTPASVTITPATDMLKIGVEQVYSASVRWSDGTETVETATWQSDAPAVATIDGSGRARGIDSGEATLVARVQDRTGTLRIRVVPNYQGTWGGMSTVRGCRASGDWEGFEIHGGLLGGEVCVDIYRVGQQVPFRASLTQDRDRLSGDIALDALVVLITSGTIRIDGGAAIAARVTIPFGGSPLTFVLEPFDVRAKADVLSGSLSLTGTWPGFSGALVVDADIPEGGVTLQSVPHAAAPSLRLERRPDRLRR